MIIDEDVYLEHFGVKGQRWGVRKEQPGSKDIVLKKGSKSYNISMNKPRSTAGKVYSAHDKADVLNYRVNYASTLKMYKETNKVFTNTFTVKKDIKVAGRDAQVKAFKNLWEKDKKVFAKVLAQTEADAKFSAAVMKKVFKQDRRDKYFNRYMDKGESWVDKKGADVFTQRLGVRGLKSPAKTAYFDYMKSRGYSAVVDLNDLKNYGSREPILIFNGNDSLGNRVSKEFTSADVQKATDAYYNQKKFDKYSLD